MLPEAFAAVREASFRTLGLRHFDVQLIGGMVLHDGQIAEMRTGEGKTLVAVLAGYLNAIPGQGVHVVTANDYLARRDCEQMGRVYRFLGMTAGLVQNGTSSEERRAACAADVTYGTASELGFDYLRVIGTERHESRRIDNQLRGRAGRQGDPGSHYRWPGWIELCEKHGLVCSMSRKGRSPDNSACEGFLDG